MEHVMHLTLKSFEGVIGETFVHKSSPYPSSLPSLFSVRLYLNAELILGEI
jgi:hypothetical protein